MNISAMKKAAALLTAMMTAVSMVACGNESAETESETASAAQSSVAESAEESEADSAADSSEPEEKQEEEEVEIDPLFAYYTLMDEEDWVYFAGEGIADGVLYYTTYDKDDRNAGASIRALDIESGEDRELYFIPANSSFRYCNGYLYSSYSLYSLNNPDTSYYVEKYDLDGNKLDSYHGMDSIQGITTNGDVVLRNGFLDPDFKEYKDIPEIRTDNTKNNFCVAGNKLYVTYDNDPILYCFDLETESWSETDIEAFCSEGHQMTPNYYDLSSRGKYLQMSIEYRDRRENEDSDYLIIDTDTGEIVARPQDNAINEKYNNTDMTLIKDIDMKEYCFVQYPADGSDYEVIEVLEGLYAAEDYSVGTIYDHGRYWVGNRLDSSSTEHWYIDLEDPDLERICFYNTNDGLISDHAAQSDTRPGGQLVPMNCDGMSFKVESIVNLYEQIEPFEFENGIYPIYTFDNGRMTVEWFNPDGSPAGDDSHERSIFEDYDLTYEFTEIDGEIYYSNNFQDVLNQIASGRGMYSSSAGNVAYNEFYECWVLCDTVIERGNFSGILTPVDR